MIPNTYPAKDNPMPTTRPPFDPNATHVTAGSWGVSYQTSSAFPGAVLNVSRIVDVPNRWGGIGDVERHLVSGMVFATVDDAQRYAYDLGLLNRYEHKAVVA